MEHYRRRDIYNCARKQQACNTAEPHPNTSRNMRLEIKRTAKQYEADLFPSNGMNVDDAVVSIQKKLRKIMLVELHCFLNST